MRSVITCDLPLIRINRPRAKRWAWERKKRRSAYQVSVGNREGESNRKRQTWVWG
jgi:hypothetical protein